MTNSAMTRITEIFTTRLQVLARLLEIAETQLRDKARDPEILLSAQLGLVKK
jgi:uncharacterized protein